VANKTPVDEKEKLSNGDKEKSKRAEGKERHKENKAKQQLKAQNRKEAKKNKAEQSKDKHKVIEQPVLDQQVEDSELSKGTNGTTPSLEPGAVEPSSSKADKKQKKIESKALKAGLSVEEYLSKQKGSKEVQSQDKDTKVPEEKGDSRKESRKKPKNLSNGDDDTAKVIAQDELAALSEKKRIKYAAKASAKGVSLEEYVAKRAQKKNKAH